MYGVQRAVEFRETEVRSNPLGKRIGNDGEQPIEIVVNDAPAIGTRAYLLLDGTRSEASAVLPDRPALRWLALSPVPAATGGSGDTPREAFASGRIVVPQAFARAVYEALRPGATVILTDEPLQPGSADVDVLISGAAR